MKEGWRKPAFFVRDPPRRFTASFGVAELALGESIADLLSAPTQLFMKQRTLAATACACPSRAWRRCRAAALDDNGITWVRIVA